MGTPLRGASGERTTSAALKGLYLPSVVLALVAGWLLLRGFRSAREGLPAVIGAGWSELAGPLILAVVLVTIVCEQIWPAERRPPLARGHLHDACFFLLYCTAVVPLVTLAGIGTSTWVLSHAPWLVIAETRRWPPWALVGATLVVMDGCNWLAHWGEHRFHVLWRMHAVHHTQEEISVLTSFRAHPLVHTTGFLLATVPVIALTADRPLAPIVISIYLGFSLLQHANVPWSYGLFGRVFVSPAYHRLHHAIDGPQNANLGVVLTVWDVLARRAVFQDRRTTDVCRTGLAGRPIAVEQEGPRPHHLRTMSAQLLEPFVAPRRAARPTYIEAGLA